MKDTLMPRAATGYRSLLRTPGAAAFFLTAAVGRVGAAMTGLGLLWLLHARTGSYGTAHRFLPGIAGQRHRLPPRAVLVTALGAAGDAPLASAIAAAGLPPWSPP